MRPLADSFSRRIRLRFSRLSSTRIGQLQGKGASQRHLFIRSEHENVAPELVTK